MSVRLAFILFITTIAVILWLTPTLLAYHREKEQQRTAQALREHEKAVAQKNKEATALLEQTKIALSEGKQRRLNELTYNIQELRSTYPSPSKKWQDIQSLKQDVNKNLFYLIDKLEPFRLSNKEMLLCVSCLVYPDMNSTQLATHIIYSSVGIRTLKQRTANKIGTTAARLRDCLTELVISS